MEKLDIFEQFFDKDNREISWKDKKVTRSKFIRIGIRKAIISNCKFCQCIGVDVYARNAVFEKVDFTGSIFIGCDFSYAKFDNCIFDYCKFYNCFLPEKEIEKCLPTAKWNLRKELANNLKVNFNSIGRKDLADYFLEIEIRAKLREKWNIVWSTNEHYQKYHCLARLKKLGEYMFGKILFYITGYGIKCKYVLLSYFVVLFLLAVIFWLCCKSDFWGIWLEGFAQSLGVSFSSSIEIPLGGYSFGGKWFILLYRSVGVIYLAILTATLYRKIAK